MALPFAISEYFLGTEDNLIAQSGIDAGAGDNILIAAGDVVAGKRIVVMGYQHGADAAQLFIVKDSAGAVIAHLVTNGEYECTRGIWLLPAGTGLTVDFDGAVAGSHFNATVKLINA